MKNIVIFGAGEKGRLALLNYKEQVAFFLDNNKNLHGKKIDGIDIKGWDELLNNKDKYKVIIAAKSYETMKQQLIDNDILNYEIYSSSNDFYYATNELIFNPYVDNSRRNLSEKDWNELREHDLAIEATNKITDELYFNPKLFSLIEIETLNRCNGTCAFCCVNKNVDKREYAEMTDELFKSIIEQLSDINYSDGLALFCNNEPFLDNNIIDKHKYAREKLPNARMYLFTNGTLLTIDKFVAIMQYLDELIIDNYHEDLKLIKPCKEIAKYCEKHPELKQKVTIVLRKPNEILNSRGGIAPNRHELVSYPQAKCSLPFKQMIVRPDGKVSLCCNDALGHDTLGDLTKESLLDVWNGEKFKQVREALYKGRTNWPHCVYCDYFSC